MKTLVMDKSTIEVDNQKKFKVSYALKTYVVIDGDVFVLPDQYEQIETDSNDLHYAFLDISEKHKGENVLGLEIRSIH